MSRISAVFRRLREQGRNALIPFITAGDPQPALTVALMHALRDAGADLIELGVPFSDPMADGPTIQRSSERALRQGVGLKDVLEMVGQFRRTDSATPVVLMGYLNPIEAMGVDAFAEAARSAGVDGVLAVDAPPEESATLLAALRSRAIDAIFLLAPTSRPRRIEAVAQVASGYVYYVSLKGVTGASHLDLEEVGRKVAEIRKRVPLPVGVGFGIRDGDTARAVAAVADAVVIGSRLVEEIEQAPIAEAVQRAGDFLRGIRRAMDQ